MDYVIGVIIAVFLLVVFTYALVCLGAKFYNYMQERDRKAAQGACETLLRLQRKVSTMFAAEGETSPTWFELQDAFENMEHVDFADDDLPEDICCYISSVRLDKLRRQEDAVQMKRIAEMRAYRNKEEN